MLALNQLSGIFQHHLQLKNNPLKSPVREDKEVVVFSRRGGGNLGVSENRVAEGSL